MEKAMQSGADAVILDLEDSVTPDRKPWARKDVATFLENTGRQMLLVVRVNALHSPFLRDDLDAVMPASPDAIMLPKAEGGASVSELAAMLGLSDTKILPIATETPRSVFALGSFESVAQKLCGLTWGAEDLPATLGALTARNEDGSFTPPYEIVRALALFAAHAAGVPAIETVYPDFRNLDGLRVYAQRGRRDGFSGMMAIHPLQVPIINDAFQPSEAEVAHARAVVALFEANPGAGVFELDGKMVDLPHLKAARRLLGGL